MKHIILIEIGQCLHIMTCKLQINRIRKIVFKLSAEFPNLYLDSCGTPQATDMKFDLLVCFSSADLVEFQQSSDRRTGKPIAVSILRVPNGSLVTYEIISEKTVTGTVLAEAKASKNRGVIDFIFLTLIMHTCF